MKQAEEKLAKARAIIKMQAPYFITSVLGFVPKPTEGIRTMGLTKGMVLLYDPEWIIKIPDEEVAAALIHEVHHHLHEHLPRIECLGDPQRGNIAADLAINPMIRSAGWKLPHFQLPEHYGFEDGATLETYYDLLSQKQQGQPQPKPQSGGGSPQQGPPKPQPGGGGQQPPRGQPPTGRQPGQTPGAGGSRTQPGPGQGSGKGPVQPGEGESGIGRGQCGGIAGNPINKELEDAVDAEVGRDPDERKLIAKRTLEEVKKHAAAFGRGSVPGGLLETIDRQEEKSKIKWFNEFRHLVRKATGRIEAGGMDFSLARPSKRSFVRGFPRPSLIQRVPEVAIIIDTSGSMGTKQIMDSIREAIAIFTSLGLDMAWFIQADTKVAADPRRIRIRDLMGEIKIHGGGGTNFDPALRKLSELKPKPELAVYFTDGDGHATFKPKGIELIWCVVDSYYNKAPVEWGHTVLISSKNQ